MQNTLIKPYTNKQYAEFASSANKNGQRIEITEYAAYRLFPYEIIQNDTIVNISDTRDYQESQANERKDTFCKDFIEVDTYCLRKIPRGYSSLVEAFNAMANVVNLSGSLPEGTLTFYTKPDFTLQEQCSEEWFVANAYKNQAMSAQEFGELYVAFMTVWSMQEHALVSGD